MIYMQWTGNINVSIMEAGEWGDIYSYLVFSMPPTFSLSWQRDFFTLRMHAFDSSLGCIVLVIECKITKCEQFNLAMIQGKCGVRNR